MGSAKPGEDVRQPRIGGHDRVHVLIPHIQHEIEGHRFPRETDDAQPPAEQVKAHVLIMIGESRGIRRGPGFHRVPYFLRA
jgi:hypothetical protein